MSDILDKARERIKAIDFDIATLANEQQELETFVRVYGQLLSEESRAKPAVDAVDGSAMSEGEAVALSPETAEAGSRLDAGRTASATSETMDVTAGETATVPLGPEAGDATPEAPEANVQGGIPVGANDGLTVETVGGNESETAEEGEDRPEIQVLPNDIAPDKSGGEQSSPAPTLADRLIALNAEHPEFTATEAAERVGATRGTVKVYSGQHGLEWAPEIAADPSKSLLARVRAVHAAHPDWTGTQVHAAIPGSKINSVSAYLSTVRAETREKAASAHPPAPAPEPAQTEERPPAPIRPPVASIPSGTGSAVVTKPMQRVPRGTRFYLRDDAGLYLHYGCTNMTSDKAYAWTGTADQLLACRQKFALARDLTERVVEKEAARVVA